MILGSLDHTPRVIVSGAETAAQEVRTIRRKRMQAATEYMVLPGSKMSRCHLALRVFDKGTIRD